MRTRSPSRASSAQFPRKFLEVLPHSFLRRRLCRRVKDRVPVALASLDPREEGHRRQPAVVAMNRAGVGRTRGDGSVGPEAARVLRPAIA